MKRIINKYFPIAFLLILLVSCGTTKNSASEKKMDQKLENGHFIIDAPIVELAFVIKNGKVSSYTDLYVRRNIQDYFIKFCESEITKKQLDALISMKDGVSQSMKLEVEIKDGFWDSCNTEEMVQSRTGQYIVIYKILD